VAISTQYKLRLFNSLPWQEGVRGRGINKYSTLTMSSPIKGEEFKKFLSPWREGVRGRGMRKLNVKGYK
jgi:hypothetical protein